MKIYLKTGPVRLPGRMREPDMDHATQIREFIERGYTVTALDKAHSFWSVSILKYPDQAFVNRPEGTEQTIRVHVNYGTENAALYDEPIPEWVTKLDKLIRISVPSTTHISSNILLNNPGDTNG